MRRSVVLALAVVAGSVTMALPAQAGAITTDQPATNTAVAVLTADPEQDPLWLPGLREAYDAAVDRAMANPAELAMPYLSDDLLMAPVTQTASATAVSTAQAELNVTASTDTLTGGEDTPAQESDKATAEPLRLAPLTAGPSVTIRPTVPRVRYSLAQLSAVQDEILTLPGTADLRAAHIDAEHNRVLVKTAAVTQELREALASRYGADRVALYLIPGMPALDGKATRGNDSSPYWGGASFYTGVAGCTTAFAWVDRGASYLLSAGHCTAMNGKAYNTGHTLGTVTADNWGNSVGTVKVYGQNYYAGDASLIRLEDGQTSSAKIYAGGPDSSSWRGVTARWTKRSGRADPYCVGGHMTGEMCGFKVTATNVTTRYGNQIARGVTEGYRYGKCTQHGDSGAPIYTIRSGGSGGVAAKGVLSGGTTNTSGNCRDYFTDTTLIEQSFPGDLRISS
ncbi:peptidase [Longispora fulva]|uniref:Streptogrisin C n=1 Tax=Longispora fulva TaxID=619741 RepID=A0A8J7KUE1_9ACTN|nr:S1 family peptidase [Longispora fulva]MBG6133952.1 hypothetical protein [Longispora fulva]GIG63486.1 peptidase [Longispora fulva]